MSENKHTPETWAYGIVRNGEQVGVERTLAVAKQWIDAEYVPLVPMKQRDELQEEVNALKERAEYDLAEFARTLDISYAEINLLKKQRDGLLSSLKRFADYPGAVCQADYDIARAAIAAAKGGAA